MRALICGGRDFHDRIYFRHALNNFQAIRGKITCVIEGGANGADALAKQWAIDHEIPLIEMPANWRQFGVGAGPIRNGWMLEHGKPDIVIAFPGKNGTKNMIDQARKAGVEVWLAA